MRWFSALLVVLCALSSSALPTPTTQPKQKGNKAAKQAAGVAKPVAMKPLPKPSQAPPPKFSLWSAAKRFFSSRERTKAAVASHHGAFFNATKAGLMPSSFGVSYKHMVQWYCTQPENKAKKMCEPGPAVAGELVYKPTAADSKDIYKLYCADPARKTTPLCALSVLKGLKGAPAGAAGSGKPPL